MPVTYRSELAVRADPASRPGSSPIPVLDLNLSLFSAPPVPLRPRRHDSTWQGPPWESVPCVLGHGRIIRPRVGTSVGPGRPSERRGRVAGRELAERPAVDPGGGRAAVPCVPVPEVSQTRRSYSTASRPGSLQIPGASVLAQNDRGASGRSGTPGPVPSGTPSAGRRGPDQGCEASVDRWGSGSKIRVSVSLLD
jgi:hypothetical protein